MIRRDLCGIGFIRLGLEVPVVVIRIGKLIVFGEPIQIIMIVGGREKRGRPVAH